MALFFITGVSGSGKSELSLALRARGYQAYDTDDDGLARWQNIASGYIHPKSSVKADQRTAEFLAQQRWIVPRQVIEDIGRQAGDKPAFICGVAHNIEELRDLFDAVFALVIDESTLRSRLAVRTNNDWGKQPHELAQSLADQREANETYGKLGYVSIDARQPADEIVEIILKTVIGVDGKCMVV